MVCKYCGEPIPSNNSPVCPSCGKKLKLQEVNDLYYDIKNEDEGFARPNSNYIRPQVIKSKSEPSTIDFNKQEKTNSYYKCDSQASANIYGKNELGSSYGFNKNIRKDIKDSIKVNRQEGWQEDSYEDRYEDRHENSLGNRQEDKLEDGQKVRLENRQKVRLEYRQGNRLVYRQGDRLEYRQEDGSKRINKDLKDLIKDYFTKDINANSEDIYIQANDKIDKAVLNNIKTEDNPIRCRAFIIKELSRIKFINNKRKVLYSAAILLLLIVVSAFLKIGSYFYDTFLEPKKAIELFNNPNKNETVIFNEEGKLIKELAGDLLPIYYSKNYADAMLFDPENRVFYYVSDKKQIQIASALSLSFNNVSNDNKILFSTKDSDGKSCLKLFDPKKKTSTIIGEENIRRYDGACISPDGRSYAYTLVGATNDASSGETYVKINGGKEKSIGKGIGIFMISDNGEYIYYYKLKETFNISDMEFYVRVNGEEIYLGLIQPISFNQDRTEMLYQKNYESGTYLFKDKNIIDLMDNFQIKKVITPTNREGGTIKSSLFLNIDTFKNKVILSSDNLLRYINKDYQSITLATAEPDMDRVFVSRDQKEVMTKNSLGDILRFTDLNGNCNKEVVAEGVKDFFVSGDLSEVYYLKGNNKLYNGYSIQLADQVSNLYYKNKNNEPVLVDNNIIDLQMNKSLDTIFFIKVNLDGGHSLFYCKNGSKPREIKGHPEADSLALWNSGVILKEKNNYRYNLYYNSKGTEFKLIKEDVSFSEQMETLY